MDTLQVNEDAFEFVISLLHMYQCFMQPSTPNTAIIPFPSPLLLQKMTRRAWEAGRGQKGELSLSLAPSEERGRRSV